MGNFCFRSIAICKCIGLIKPLSEVAPRYLSLYSIFQILDTKQNSRSSLTALCDKKLSIYIICFGLLKYCSSISCQFLSGLIQPEEIFDVWYMWFYLKKGKRELISS